MTFALTTLDPAAPLDDLEPLAAPIGDARVVAIGETAHHVREYQLVRHRLLRFLVERMGFTTLALESGFSEGLAVDAWIHGAPGEVAAVAGSGLTYRFGECAEARDLLDRLRIGKVSFAGLDLPADLASMAPALDHLDDVLAAAGDAAGRELLSQVRGRADRFASAFTMPAFAAYASMPIAERDALTLGLAGLAARLDALRPMLVAATGTRAFAIVRHELRLAVALDQMLRAQLAGTGLNVRDAAMARTVEWLLEQGAGRMVIGAGNTHVQRRHPLLPVLGAHLAALLGDGYRAIGVTCHGGVTPTRRRAPDAPAGAETVGVELAPPVAGSVETELGERLVVADLRPMRGGPGPDRIRLLDTWAEQPVAEAFDLVLGVPRIAPSEQGIWAGGR